MRFEAQQMTQLHPGVSSSWRLRCGGRPFEVFLTGDSVDQGQCCTIEQKRGSV